MATTYEIVQGLAQAAANAYDGALDEDRKPHGQGTLTAADGTTQEGSFQHGVLHGKGKITRANGIKKIMAVFTLDNGRTRTVHFGSAGASDYTQHRDPVRKQQYLARHAPREDWNNPMTAGALSRWVLFCPLELEVTGLDWDLGMFLLALCLYYKDWIRLAILNWICYDFSPWYTLRPFAS